MTPEPRSGRAPGPGRGNWNVAHGAARRGKRLPEYGVWAKMRSRCEKPTDRSYVNYGGRGLAVCERWQKFENFYADMGPRPSKDHTLERVDNYKGYTPDNCVWATRDVQAKNRRPRKRQHVCARGHELAADNVYVRSNGKRGCRECRRLNMANYYARQKDTQ
jgi:hypothetical protein